MQKLEVGLLALTSILTAAGLVVSVVVLVNGKKNKDAIEDQNKLLKGICSQVSNSEDDFPIDLGNDADNSKDLELKRKISKAKQELGNVEEAASLMKRLTNVINQIQGVRKNTVFTLNASDYPFLFDDDCAYFQGKDDVDRLFDKCEDIAKSSDRAKNMLSITAEEIWTRLTGEQFRWFTWNIPVDPVRPLCLAMQEEINIRTEDAKKALDDAYSEYTKFREKIKKAKETEKKKD